MSDEKAKDPGTDPGTPVREPMLKVTVVYWDGLEGTFTAVADVGGPMTGHVMVLRGPGPDVVIPYSVLRFVLIDDEA